MTITKPFDLFIGRRKTRVTESARLVVEPEVETNTYQDLPHTVLIAQSYQLFIADKLFASVRILAKRPYSRSPIVVKKPDTGPLQIHFVKKYVTLH